MPTLAARTEHVRDILQQAVAHRFAAHGIAYLAGVAQLDADRTVRVASPDGRVREVAARAVLVATGSRPTHHPGIPFDDPDVYDSDEIYSLRTIPKDIVIVGGGPIGVEFATVFTALSIPATLISNSERLLPAIDAELAALMADEFTRRGVQLVLGASAEGVRRVNGRLEVTLSTGTVLAADAVLFAAGRTANTEGLGLQQAGVRLNAHGRIVVDRYHRTTAPGDLRSRRRGHTRAGLPRHAARTRSSRPRLRTVLRRGDRPKHQQRRLRPTRSRQRRGDRTTAPGHRHPLRRGPLRPGHHPPRSDRRTRRATQADLPRRQPQAARRPLLRRHRLRSGRPGPRRPPTRRPGSNCSSPSPSTPPPTATPTTTRPSTA